MSAAWLRLRRYQAYRYVDLLCTRRLGRAALSDEKYVICNAGEGEPGTFKDRSLPNRSPKDVLIGIPA